MKLDFYYYSYQCPLNDTMLSLLEEYKDRIDIRCFDISDNQPLARTMNLFFPTLTVLNGRKRYYSPLRKSFLEQAAQGIYPVERPFLPQLSDKVVSEILEPIRAEKVVAACACAGKCSEQSCTRKRKFLEGFEQEVYGFLHRDKENHLLGGAEYLPAWAVPYPVPHERDSAFLTCIYMSDSEYDYKTAPLKALEAYLKGTYKRVIAVSDETGVFPNGDLGFFLRNGYQDEGVIYQDANYCRLHLVSKEL